jgi:hypothetical protein
MTTKKKCKKSAKITTEIVTEDSIEELNRLGEDYGVEPGALLTETRVRPKLRTDLSPEQAKLIEEVRPDARGRLIPRLYSKAWANAELRKMHNLSAKSEAPDVTKLSDAELVAQLAEQAKQLGVTIDLSYSFAQQPPAAKTDGQDISQVIDDKSDVDKR